MNPVINFNKTFIEQQFLTVNDRAKKKHKNWIEVTSTIAFFATIVFALIYTALFLHAVKPSFTEAQKKLIDLRINKAPDLMTPKEEFLLNIGVIIAITLPFSSVVATGAGAAIGFGASYWIIKNQKERQERLLELWTDDTVIAYADAKKILEETDDDMAKNCLARMDKTQLAAASFFYGKDKFFKLIDGLRIADEKAAFVVDLRKAHEGDKDIFKNAFIKKLAKENPDFRADLTSALQKVRNSSKKAQTAFVWMRDLSHSVSSEKKSKFHWVQPLPSP